MIRRHTELPADVIRCWMGSGVIGLLAAVLGSLS
jgi:hypothetical protein